MASLVDKLLVGNQTFPAKKFFPFSWDVENCHQTGSRLMKNLGVALSQPTNGEEVISHCSKPNSD